MVLTFNTAATGSSNNTVTLPLRGSVNVTVDWGDGTAAEIVTTAGNKSHTYATAGTYTVSINGSMTTYGFGGSTPANAEKLVSLNSFGALGIYSLSGAFSGTTNLTTLPATLPLTVTDLSYSFLNSKFNGDISGWDVSNVTTMLGMFQNATVFNQNLSGWNVSKVTNMGNMFATAKAFNANISNWDVSNVTNMDGMFSSASVFNQNIGSWNVSKVTTMANMFQYAPVFNQDLNTWNVSNVTNMSCMFMSATAFNGNVGSWDVSKVTNMDQLFRSASAFNQNIGGWNTANVLYMSRMFMLATAFNQEISNWDVSKVVTMEYMFAYASKFNQNLPNWNTVKVTNMMGMFQSATVFNGDVSNWNVSALTSMGSMFQDARSFNKPLNNWDVSKVTYMASLFTGAAVFNQNLNRWNVSNVTNMSQMFNAAYVFNGDISTWNVSKITTMSTMFSGANAFNGDLSAWDVSNVTDMSYMFYHAHAFDKNINTWNVSKVTNMFNMFYCAYAFNQNISSWDVSKVTNMGSMFQIATAFNQNIGNWNVSNVTNMSTMFGGANAFNQNIGAWNVSNVTNMASMFNGVTLSTVNYDAILNGWSALTLKTAVPFSGGSSKYSSCAVAGRAILTGTYGWTITDGGSNGGVPVLFTQAVSDVAAFTAYGNGNIYCLGTPNPTAFGFCWSTTANPTISSSKVDKGSASATGTFTAELTGLSPATTYYVRAYATNAAGTSYGEQVSFKTKTILTWTGAVSTDWDSADNWSPAQVPTVEDLVVVNSGAANYPLAGIKSSCYDLAINGGSVTVPPAKMLAVKRNIINNVGASALVVKADENGLLPNGTLTFQNKQNNSVSGTVEMHSKSTTDLNNETGNKYNWQHFGIPVRTTQMSPTFDDAFVREYNERGTSQAAQWAMKYTDDVLTSFKGYELAPNTTRANGQKYVFTGVLENNSYSSGLLGYTPGAYDKGYNLLANSYTAAVDIASVQFGADMMQTIYLFNTGSFNAWVTWNSSEAKDTANSSTGGQYMAIPKEFSGIGGLPSTIPSMQAFVVRATGDVSDSIFIPYSFTAKNTEMQRIRRTHTQPLVLTKVVVAADGGMPDCVWLFSNDNCTHGFDNGFDGEKIEGSTLSPQLFVAEPSGNYQVNAVNDIHNTTLGFRPGSDMLYTMTFIHENLSVRYSLLYLVDLLTNTTIDITASGTSYKFSATGSDIVNRFKIVTNANTSSLSSNNTGLIVYGNSHRVCVNNLTGSDGIAEVYNTTGQCVNRFSFANNSLSTKSNYLLSGTYIVKVMLNSDLQVIEKIIISN